MDTADGPSVQTKPVRDEAAALGELTKGGGLKGRVYGHADLRPGHKVATSRIVEFSPACEEPCEQRAGAAGARLRHFQLRTAGSAATLCEGALVVTKSLSVYRLGAPRPMAAAVSRATAQAAQAAPASDPATFPDDAPAAVVSEAEGYQLTLSANKTGYWRFYPRSGGTFEVRLGVSSGNTQGQRYVSCFDTAVAAALWIAKYTAGEDPQTPSGTHMGAGAQVAVAPSAVTATATFPADAPAAVVSEVEGYQLTLSANKTGYWRVYPRSGGTFEVRLGVSSGNTQGQRCVACFDTAVAAALWIAKYTAGEDPQTPSGKHLRAGGHQSTPPQPRAAVQAAAAPLVAPATFSADAPLTVVSEADGYNLHRSATSKNGYLHVCERPAGRYCIQFNAKRIRGAKRPPLINVLGFATAVEAALWYAKHIAGEDPPMPNGEKFRPTWELAMPRPHWEAQGGAAAAAAAAAQQEGDDAHSPSGQAATPPPVVAWADGVQLHLSPDSDTGYECVARYGPCFVLNFARFREKKRDADGRLRRRQKLATAQEAAVEYARLVATAPGGLQR